MAVKRAKTTRRPASSAATGKPTKGRSATSKPVKAAKPGAAAKRPAARVSAQSSRADSKSAAGKGAARPVAKQAAVKRPSTEKSPAKKQVAAAKRDAASKPPKPLSGVARVTQVVEGALDEMKAVQVKVLDVRQLTDFADTLVIASGNSDRHVRSIAERVVEHAKKAGLRAMGIEGLRDGEWVLVDLQDVIVHVMLPRIRELYRLEDLWDVSAARREAASDRVAV